jgi:hypothetical protein
MLNIEFANGNCLESCYEIIYNLSVVAKLQWFTYTVFALFGPFQEKNINSGINIATWSFWPMDTCCSESDKLWCVNNGYTLHNAGRPFHWMWFSTRNPSWRTRIDVPHEFTTNMELDWLIDWLTDWMIHWFIHSLFLHLKTLYQLKSIERCIKIYFEMRVRRWRRNAIPVSSSLCKHIKNESEEMSSNGVCIFSIGL